MEMKLLNEATLRLFKAVYLADNANVSISEESMVISIAKGILFAPNVRFTNDLEALQAISDAEKLYGVNLVTLSNTFHKTWKTVEEITPELHYLQQILHYITTYGFDALDIPYDSNNTYIPAEKVPYVEGVAPYKFTIIRAINDDELMDRIDTLLTSGVALSQQQVLDVITVLNFMGEKDLYYDFAAIKNKEVKAILWDKIEDKPYIPVDEFLRVLTYKVRGTTLLVRSHREHEMNKLALTIKPVLQDQVAELFNYYVKRFGMENVASQFLRNKMVFLSFKCEKTKSLINKIRREAEKYHKPQSDVHLVADDIITANIWQLFKYYNLCLSHLNPTPDKLYQIRNGKNYLTENKNYGLSGEPKRIVTEHYAYFKKLITERIVENLASLKDKIFLIPDYIDYKIPTSLKRLASGVPEGTMLTFDDNCQLTVGIHWENQKRGEHEQRVDLDLHANALDGSSIGWYSSYRNGKVMYSGDVTDAPISKGGASEAITFKDTDEAYIITMNDFTQLDKIPFKFIFDLDYQVTEEDSRHETRGYIFSPNARVLNAKVDRGQHSLGLVMKNKFYFLNSDIFEGPVTYNTDLLKRLISYYEEAQSNSLTFRELADIVGFTIVNSKDDIPMVEEIIYHEDADNEIVRKPADYIDLSLEAITEDTFPQIFKEAE